MNLAVPTIKCEESPSPGAPVGAAGEGEGLLSVNLSAAVVHLADGGTAALRTPEIVNDVITMTNPLDQYAYGRPSGFKPLNNDSNSSLSNASSSVTSPASGTPNSIQKTCSELIKAGLKLSIESKRKMSGSDTDIAVKKMKREDSDEDYDSSHTHMTKSDGLTPEDEERRRRRRERNKIAATKCRLKKRERTVNLVTESEVLETQNIDLKAQVKDLEVQKRQLLEMLSLHAPSCVKNTRRSPAAPYSMRYEPPAFPPGFDTHSPYIRPESANVLASSYTCIADPAMEQPYMPQMVELEYPREMTGEYPQAEPYLPKHNLLPLEPEQDYYEGEGYMPQPCHSYPPAPPDQPLNPALNDGCLV